MGAGCAPLLLAIKETMGIGGTRRIGATAGNRTLVTRLGRPAASHTHGSNEKSRLCGPASVCVVATAPPQGIGLL